MALFLLFALPIILLFLLLQRNRKSEKTRVPPGPPPLPLIGNLHQIIGAGDLSVYFWKLSKIYGPIIQLKLASIPLVVVSSAKLAEEVLKKQDSAFCSRPKLLGMKKLSYDCTDVVFAPYGDYWREMKKITVIHLFSLKKIQSFRPFREEEISRLIEKISSIEGVVNLSEMAMAFSSTLICRIAFGKRYDEHGSEMRRFDELLRDAQAAMATFYVSDLFPSLGWVDKVSGYKRWLDTIFEKLDSFYQELIDDHLDPYRVEKIEKDMDILDLLIQLKQDRSCAVDLNWDHVKALLMNIFIGGTDTSAASTVWTMMALIKAPRVMKKLQEILRNYADNKKGRIDEDDLPQLPYVNAVIMESLRLYPPVPLLVPRETMEECSLEGYQIKPNSLVYVNAWAIGRNPECWKNPDEFMPERFLNNTIDVKGRNFGLVPFGSGRRICPGMPMGLANVKLMVANLVYSLDWELPPGVGADDIDTEPQPGITVHKKTPLILVAKKY